MFTTLYQSICILNTYIPSILNILYQGIWLGRCGLRIVIGHLEEWGYVYLLSVRMTRALTDKPTVMYRFLPKPMAVLGVHPEWFISVSFDK